MIDIELIRKAIPAGKLIYSAYYFEDISSTNEYASSLADQDGVLVIAAYQSKGKGRLGRKWDAAKGLNLTFSIKKNFNIPYSENQMITFFFSYFLYSAIKEFIQENHPDTNADYLHIKWPNDIMYEDKKLCGLLIESKNMGKDYVIGIGINVNQTDFQKELNAQSVMNITGKETNLNTLLVSIIQEFEKNISMLENRVYSKIFELWKNSTDLIGKTCEFIIDGDVPKRGIINDLRQDGSIIIQSGIEEKSYFSGEIKLTGFAAKKALISPKIT